MPAIDRLSGGGFVVAWQSNNDPDDSIGLFGRRFDAAATPVDSYEFQLTQRREGTQNLAALGGLSENNSFAASWSDNDLDTVDGSTGVGTRLFTGTASGGPSVPTVTTATQSGVTHNSATLGGNVTADGGAEATERGIVWGTSADPTTSNNKVQMSSGTGPFSQLVTGLPSSTTVHVRAYAINSAGTAYGGNISFATSAAPAPEIAVSFDGNNVADGSLTPVALNGTDFGSVPVAGVTRDHVFTITNSGTAALTVGTVSATGDFSVQAQPSGSVAAGGGTTTFTIRFDPSTTGTRAGTVSFGTNDSDKNPFNFSVQGTGTGPQTFDLAGNAISNTSYDGGETYIYTTNSAPTDITLTPSSIAENNAPGAAVGTLAAVDANLADTHTFELVAGSGDADNGSFTIDGATLELDVTADHETQSSYSIRVRATDSGAGNLAFEKELTVGVTDVNEAPQITSNGGGASGAVSVEENATVVTTVTATDEDLPAQTLSFSISGGADQALFSIHGSTGVLSFISAPDFEDPKDTGGDNVYDVVVRVADNGTGTLAVTQALAVTVTDVNDAPTIGGGMLVYEVTNPVRVANNIEYAVNNAAALSGASFSRVRYRMQTTVAGEVRYADVSFDAWPGLTVEGLRVPTPNDPFIVQRNVGQPHGGVELPRSGQCRRADGQAGDLES